MLEYLSALSVHWVALVTGSGAALIGLALRIGRRVSETIKSWSDVPDWLLICFGIMCLFYAGYMTWQDKNKALVALQEKLRSPTFTGRLNSAWVGVSAKGDKFIMVEGIITNPFGPASSVVNWKISVEFPDGQIIPGEVPIFSGIDMKIPLKEGKGSVTLPAQKYWPQECLQPIAPGGAVAGWLLASFGDLDFQEAHKKKALIILEITDAIANKTHRFTGIVPGTELYIPILNR